MTIGSIMRNIIKTASLIPLKATNPICIENACQPLPASHSLQEFHTMTTISDFLVPDHKRCDSLFAAAESAVSKGDWDAAAAQLGSFRDALLHHFAMEEEVMFPAFEASTGMTQGPTAVMRSEHRQMTTLLNLMADTMARKNRDGFLGDADTLLIVMQQHNVKEEQMLYRMADQALAGELDGLLERMRAVH